MSKSIDPKDAEIARLRKRVAELERQVEALTPKPPKYYKPKVYSGGGDGRAYFGPNESLIPKDGQHD